MGGRPEKTVMDNQQIGPGLNGQAHGCQAGIHRGGNAGDCAAIVHLESVDGAGVVAALSGAHNLVAVFCQSRQGNGWHKGMKAKAGGSGKGEGFENS